jgi:hypothetical protein
MGPVSIKLYDKQGLALRIETTVNDITFFRHYRTVEHRDKTSEAKVAAMQKITLKQRMAAANRRYLELWIGTGGFTRRSEVSEFEKERP